jgi:hypothetical protein
MPVESDCVVGSGTMVDRCAARLFTSAEGECRSFVIEA